MTAQPPRRRHSPAVYRRRRLVVLLAILAIAAGVVWLLVAQPWRGAAAESASPAAQRTPSASTPSPTEGASPGAAPGATDDAQGEEAVAETPQQTAPAEPTAPACAERDLVVEPVVGQDSYAADQNPQFSIRLTNTGSADCTLNVGTSAQSFTVMSGSDIWWRSTDCQSEPSDMVVLLTAGQDVTSAVPLTWDRTRSAVGTCDEPSRPRAPGGGASYHLSVEIAGIPSTTSAQFLLY